MLIVLFIIFFAAIALLTFFTTLQVNTFAANINNLISKIENHIYL
jgi:hypothetical protein